MHRAISLLVLFQMDFNPGFPLKAKRRRDSICTFGAPVSVSAARPYIPDIIFSVDLSPERQHLTGVRNEFGVVYARPPSLESYRIDVNGFQGTAGLIDVIRGDCPVAGNVVRPLLLRE
jgi:hypothetical protein